MAKKDLTPAASDAVINSARMSASDIAIAESITQQLQIANERREAFCAERDARAAQATPPSNTGGKYQNREFEKLVVTETGDVKMVLPRMGHAGDVAFVDWLNFTVHEATFYTHGIPVTDDQLIASVSLKCQSLFGFGITAKRDRGLNFYRTSYTMADELGNVYGHVCYGGQRDSVLIQLTGEGLAAAMPGWELRTVAFLEGAICGRITRVDLAYDDFTGESLSAEHFEKAYDDGQFNCGGRNPDIELRGNWKNPNGKGRTIYIGNRSNGKFFRGYEKGCQLGCATSKWFRAEVEFKSVDRHIPFDVLLRAGEYLSAAYPALNFLNQRQERILTIQNTVTASYEKTKKWLKHQCGSALNLMLKIEGDADKVLALVAREGKYPRGMVVPDYRNCGEFMHDLKRETQSTEYMLGLAFN